MPRRFRGRSLRIRTLPIKYNPSSQARRWHASQKRFRFLVCGLKSGKTYAGAFECLRQACKRPKQLVWAAAPTTRNLEEAHRQFMNLLFQVPEIVHINRQKPREVELTNGTLVQFHTLDRPDNLRGPNVDYCWMEEAAFAKAEAWDVIRGRVAATRGGVGATTTPNGRNWLWNELLIGGLPPHCPEGEFESDTHFVSRYPTWDFPWVDAEYIADEKRRLPKAKFDQEYGADFSFGADEVFRNVEECFDFVPPPKNVKERCVLGVDLGKHQDFSGVVGMEGGGRVLHVERWSGVDWIIQRARIVELSKKWNAVVVLDVSNVGSVIEEDLRRAGVPVRFGQRLARVLDRLDLNRLALVCRHACSKKEHPPGVTRTGIRTSRPAHRGGGNLHLGRLSANPQKEGPPRHGAKGGRESLPLQRRDTVRYVRHGKLFHLWP
ncbi:hypothetical protein LCGC14_1826720 [marine sediment metagenome]|uniref:Uncharacterized protein n=1 Tax=marine sediment metagenome TaxID=412755 RepID=A0A0F9IWW6_9ZZZZ